MTQQDNVKKLEKAIQDKEAEIRSAEEAVAAATDAVQKVSAEKSVRILNAELQALKAAHRAATYTPPEPTDRELLLAGLKKYNTDWNERISKIQASINKSKQEAAEIERGLQKAAEEADAESTILLSSRREENRAAQRHLSEMLDRARALPVYPAGAIDQEWNAICSKLLPEWENRIITLQTLAMAYRTAADDFFRFTDTIRAVREELNRKQDSGNCITAFTPGWDPETFTVNRSYQARLKGIFEPLTGQRL